MDHEVCDTSYEELLAKYRRAVEVLRDVEWQEDGPLNRYCASCRGTKRAGHLEDCPLEAVLKEAE